MKPVVGTVRIKKPFGRWERKVYIDAGHSCIAPVIGIYPEEEGDRVANNIKGAINQAYDAGYKEGVEETQEGYGKLDSFRKSPMGSINMERLAKDNKDRINISSQITEYAKAFAAHENQEILNAMTICARQGYNLSELELIYNAGRINREPAGTLQLTSRFSIKHKPTNKIIWPQ